MTDKTDGQVAYEAAAKLTKCSQPWSEANKCKWEEAARAVKKSFVEQSCGIAETIRQRAEYGYSVDSAYDKGLYQAAVEIQQAIRDKFK